MIPHILPKYQHSEDCGPFRRLISQENTQNLRLLNSVFDDAHNYGADTPVDNSSEEEKCIGARTHGLASMRVAGIEMNAVAAENLRCQDPAFRFILSWPEHERPDSNLVCDAAEHAIKSLGLHDHQYIIWVFGHTDNIHCQALVNRIHPETFKSHHIAWSKKTLHLAARESEIKYGWSHDDGIYVVEQDSNNQKHIVLNKKYVNGRMS